MATASQVSRALKAAGQTRSVSRKGPIKGLREHSQGFVVEQFTADVVQVKFQHSSLTRAGSESRSAASQDWACKYASVLIKSGFDCTVREFGNGYVVRVTK